MTYILYQKFNGAHCEKRYGKDKDSYQETLLGTAGIELIEVFSVFLPFDHMLKRFA